MYTEEHCSITISPALIRQPFFWMWWARLKSCWPRTTDSKSMSYARNDLIKIYLLIKELDQMFLYGAKKFTALQWTCCSCTLASWVWASPDFLRPCHHQGRPSCSTSPTLQSWPWIKEDEVSRCKCGIWESSSCFEKTLNWCDSSGQRATSSNLRTHRLGHESQTLSSKSDTLGFLLPRSWGLNIPAWWSYFCRSPNQALDCY